MIQKKTKIQNKIGIHARPASLLVSKAKDFECDTMIEKGGVSCSLRGVIGLMKLQCAMGDEITITCEGKDEDICVDALIDLIDSKFGEE